MFKHTQTIRRLLPMNCLSVFDHFVGLGIKRLNTIAISFPTFDWFSIFFQVVKVLNRFDYMRGEVLREKLVKLSN